MPKSSTLATSRRRRRRGRCSPGLRSRWTSPASWARMRARLPGYDAAVSGARADPCASGSEAPRRRGTPWRCRAPLPTGHGRRFVIDVGLRSLAAPTASRSKRARFASTSRCSRGGSLTAHGISAWCAARAKRRPCPHGRGVARGGTSGHEAPRPGGRWLVEPQVHSGATYIIHGRHVSSCVHVSCNLATHAWARATELLSSHQSVLRLSRQRANWLWLPVPTAWVPDEPRSSPRAPALPRTLPQPRGACRALALLPGSATTCVVVRVPGSAAAVSGPR